MSVYRLSARYAKSLLDLAVERNKVEVIFNDISLIHSIFKSNHDFLLMIESPIIHTDKKQKIVHMVLNGKADEITLKFIDILMLKGREAYLNEIAEAFIEQYNKYKNITPVKLTTAVEADEQLKKRVTELLKEKAGLINVELKTAVDASLLGGFVLQYEDKLYDASVKNKMLKLKREFSQNKFVKS